MPREGAWTLLSGGCDGNVGRPSTFEQDEGRPFSWDRTMNSPSRPKPVNVSILVPAEEEPGRDANCYRILDDPDGDGYIIDWLWYDPTSDDEDANCAIVVSRLRIPPGLMKTFQAEAAEIGTKDLTGLQIRFGQLAG